MCILYIYMNAEMYQKFLKCQGYNDFDGKSSCILTFADFYLALRLSATENGVKDACVMSPAHRMYGCKYVYYIYLHT